MRPELPLRVMASSTPTKFTLTASVGKRSGATRPRVSASGYKRASSASRTPSAQPPAPDIRPRHRYEKRRPRLPDRRLMLWRMHTIPPWLSYRIGITER